MQLAYDGASEKLYSVDYIRTANQTYSGKLITLPQIKSSVGDITRTYEMGNIIIVISDTDYELRSLIQTMSKSFLNSTVTLKIGFQDDDWSDLLTIYTGYIIDWKFLDNLRIQFEVAELSKNLENEYPDRVVNLTDYPNAHESSIGQVVPIPYGEISALGLSGNGAWGWPSLSNGTGLAFVDTTTNSEKHLVGYQNGAISVNRVYKNGVLQTPITHYAVAFIGATNYTEIRWASGVNPTENDFISCDIVYDIGFNSPVTMIFNFLSTFCGYINPTDFDMTSFYTARDKESSRGYDNIGGALWERKPLRSHLDEWRNEFELDIYWGKGGKVTYNYLSSILSSNIKHYRDHLDILGGKYDVEPKVKDMINKLDYGYNFHYSKSYYHNYDTEEDTDSQTKYGATYRAFKGMRWVRSASMALDLATRRIIRFKDPPVFISLAFPLKTFSDDLTDTLKITHYGGEGSAGYEEELVQIREQNLNLDNYTNEMKLENTSNFAGNACIFGPPGMTQDYPSATETEKQYWYLCDRSTGKFSDGSRGKQLLD